MTLNKEKPQQSKQKAKSKANHRKARVDYIAGKPGHHLDVSAEELHEDQKLGDSLASSREKAKMGVKICIIQVGLLYKRASEID